MTYDIDTLYIKLLFCDYKCTWTTTINIYYYIVCYII